MSRLQQLVQRVILIIIVLLLVDSFTVEAQTGNSRFLFGRLQRSNDKTAVSFGIVLNKTQKVNAISDSSGFFTIQAAKLDTLIISRIGYFQKIIVVSDSLLRKQKNFQIDLLEKAYDLKHVTIAGLGTYQEFKRKVVEMKLPEEEFLMNPSIKSSFPKKVIVLQPQMSIPLGSPVTALYMMFSKEGKSLRKLGEYMEKGKEADKFKHKYNPVLVSQLTGLIDAELEKFMVYCNVTNSFLETANEYDVRKKVADCFEQFKKEVIEKEQKP